jgi:hypothetical protein
VRLKDYGLRVYRQGVDFRADRRTRDPNGWAHVIPIRQSKYASSRRGQVSGLSKPSAKRLEFVAANARVPLSTLLTLTYRATAKEGESDAERNLRVARRSKRDLNRFLCCLRKELGEYLWVQEFQERGVVHYHVLCERPITEERARVVWCRAIGVLHDVASMEHGVKVETVASATGARSYVGRYFGKERQKQLPEGVAQAGRWWGRSRGLELDLLAEVVACGFKSQERDREKSFVVRQCRRYLRRRLGFKFAGGTFVDWGGELCAGLLHVVGGLNEWCGSGGLRAVEEVDVLFARARERGAPATPEKVKCDVIGPYVVAAHSPEGQRRAFRLRFDRMLQDRLSRLHGLKRGELPYFGEPDAETLAWLEKQKAGPHAGELRLDLGEAPSWREAYPE